MNMSIPLWSEWSAIDWRFVQSIVFKWQRQIYKASKSGNTKLVRKIQNRMFESEMAKLLAIRKVTQDNKGKLISGIDGVKKLTPQQRLGLLKHMKFPTKSEPVRRVWIPKPGSHEKLPLGISTIKDRCLQALFKLALEPEWEAKFEPNSYGFRPGRNCHDAISAVRSSVIKKSKFLIEADISKCFDKINYNALLDKIGMKGKYRLQLRYWLTSGILDGSVFHTPEMGTPQGGVISPLLANIALHGLEDQLKHCFNDIPVYYSSGVKVRPSVNYYTLGVIRYAGYFVVIHNNLEVIKRCYIEIQRFLESVGLELSVAKTKVCHTLDFYPMGAYPIGAEGLPFDGNPGFDFLGFTMKQFKSKHRSFRSTVKKLLNFKTLIYPSKENVKRHKEELHDIILGQSKVTSQEVLIARLNPIIRRWANYFGRSSNANTTEHLGKLDYLLYLKLRKWAKRRVKTASNATRYWCRRGSRKWVFGKKDQSSLLAYTDYSNPINDYVKVKGEYSVFDDHQNYWAKRLKSHPYFSSGMLKLLKTQKGLCALCHYSFRDGDMMEIDHITPKAAGGEDTYMNLQLLHRHCHHIKSASEKNPDEIPPNLSELLDVA